MNRKTNFSNVLAMVIVVSTFIVEMVIYFNSARDASNMATQITSSCIALQAMVVGYYFVNSRDSAKKDETILAQAQNASSSGGPTTIKTDVVNTENVEVANTQTLNVEKKQE